MSKLSVESDRATDLDDLGKIQTAHKHWNVSAAVRRDGRVSITLSETALKIAKQIDKRTRGKRRFGEDLTINNREYETEFQPILGRYTGIPRLNIAIHIVGSRGDVQPFVAIGQVLSKPPYSHRIRICTHPVFKQFVEENGLEFFSIGGDPATLMAYMVKNPGLMPGIESLRAGDVGKRRADIAEIIEGCWRGCIESGDGMGGESNPVGVPEVVDPVDRLFVADAIIANPPSYAHIHCAEKLGIPLHMMFTMPWSPTQAFPHPLASFDSNESDPNFSNYISYTMMELLAWQGLGDVINGFRQNTLNLDPISPLWGHMLLPRMKVPYTYAWSQALIPKPEDWGSHINISGFSFLSQAASYTPPADLMKFLNAGPPPVYIGFGSIVIEDPNKLTNMIFGAVKRCRVRALVSKGWGGIGGEAPPEGVFLLGNVPHDWLFNYVSCVVHHGGAGTSAIGISMGKPTVVVPFFGDQPFWGAMIYKAGAGPEPVPFKKMTEESLANSITMALGAEIQSNVKRMSEKIAGEHGAEDAAASFHAAVNMDSMRCLLSPNRVALWRVRNTNLRLSNLAASVLLDNGLVDLAQMKLVKHRDWYVDAGAVDPAMGVMAAASGTVTGAISTMVAYFRNVSKIQHRPEKKDSDSEDLPPYLESTESFNRIESRNPVTRAAGYSSHHLAKIAYQMASKSLAPTPALRNKQQERANTRGRVTKAIAARRTMSRNQALFGHQEEHGKMHDVAYETGHFIDAMLDIGLRAPVAFFYNVANGFHNAPSFLFNDETVRRRDNITGFGSGVKVAGKEFTISFYEALSGIATQPYHGARKGGAKGFGKGVVRGFGGLVFKSGAAAFAIPGYTLKGLERQLEKRRDRVLKTKILSTRIKQGINGYGRASQEEKEEVLRRFKELGPLTKA